MFLISGYCGLYLMCTLAPTEAHTISPAAPLFHCVRFHIIKSLVSRIF